MNLNKAFIAGNLTRDPELKQLPSGTNLAQFAIATNREYTDKAGQKQKFTEYHNVVAWGKLGELCHQYLKKGRMALVEGRIQTRSWDDKQTGQKKYRTEIIAENVQFGPRGGDVGQNPASSGVASAPASPKEELATVEYPADEEEINPEEMPF